MNGLNYYFYHYNVKSYEESMQTDMNCSTIAFLLCLLWGSLYVGVVENAPPPPLTVEQYGKMEQIYPEGGSDHPQDRLLRPQGVFNILLYF